MRTRRGEDSTTFLDFLFLMVLVMLLLVNPKVPPTKATTTPPGRMMAEIGWPDKDTSDIDLWIYHNCEDRPVGFSNRSGKCWSLLRDDLGKSNDALPINAEHAYAREARAGRYVFNVMCYTCRTGPVTVGFEVRIETNGVHRTLISSKVTLDFHGQELTVVQFDLDDKGYIVPGSTHNVFMPLYGDWKQ